MKHLKNLFLVSLLISCGQSSNKTDLTNSQSEWVSLFNGKNLDGWTIRIGGKELNENYANTFSVDSGILKIRYDGYENFNMQMGGLYTNKVYSNYRFRAEYRFVGDTATGAPEWGYRDSGIMFHAQAPEDLLPDELVPVALEYNLHGGDGTNPRPTGAICCLGTVVDINGKQNTDFCAQPNIQRTFHGDQWVTLEIDVRDSLITHYVNGEEILLYSNPRYDTDHVVAGTLINDGESRLTSGRIAIQSNSHPIDFRKIEILEYE